MSKEFVKLNISIIEKKIKRSLDLLNEKALKAALRVETFVAQKFIKRNEVNPINSQPKNNIIKFPEETKKTILATKRFKKSIRRSTDGSYLK